MVRSMCGSTIWNLLLVALLATRIMWYLLDFWKICAPLVWVIREVRVPFTQIDVCIGRHGGFSDRKMSLWRDEHIFVYKIPADM